MLDTILIAAGETRRTFDFRIAVDEPYPLLAAHAMLMPPGELFLEQGPGDPTGGWFFHLKERNIQILSIQPIVPSAQWTEPEEHVETVPELTSGFALRLLETEGRSRRVKLKLFRTPQQARKRDFRGRSIKELTIRKETVLIEMRPHELVDVELLYAD
jgi:alpha-mannosidase